MRHLDRIQRIDRICCHPDYPVNPFWLFKQEIRIVESADEHRNVKLRLRCREAAPGT